VIGSLRGRLAAKSPPQLLLEVGGVGYEVEAPMSTFYDLPAVGAEVRLLTHLVVRDDAHVLYGFARDEERRLFRMLLKVSGVGPKIALAILSGSSVEAFAGCVAARDVATLTRIPGVGKRTAERLVVELRDRLAADDAGISAGLEAGGGGARAEALAALVALGYRPAEATRLIETASATAGAGGDPAGEPSVEDLIRGALRSASKAGGA
jgi:Holliday junction DNA helicase RuvA